MMVYRSVNNTSHLEFHTEIKISKSSLVQKLVLLVHAGSVELVLLVQGGHLWLEQDRELIGQAKSTGVVGGVEGRRQTPFPRPSISTRSRPILEYRRRLF